MYAVIFEVWPNKNGKEEYLNIASQLKLFLEEQKGKNKLFDDYRIRVSKVLRDYSKNERSEIPEDSKE